MSLVQLQQHLTLSRQWKFAQHLSTQTWKRLIEEFIPTLLARKRWTKKTLAIEIEKKYFRLFRVWRREDSGQLDEPQETNQSMMTRQNFSGWRIKSCSYIFDQTNMLKTFYSYILNGKFHAKKFSKKSILDSKKVSFAPFFSAIFDCITYFLQYIWRIKLRQWKFWVF